MADARRISSDQTTIAAGSGTTAPGPPDRVMPEMRTWSRSLNVLPVGKLIVTLLMVSPPVARRLAKLLPFPIVNGGVVLGWSMVPKGSSGHWPAKTAT